MQQAYDKLRENIRNLGKKGGKPEKIKTGQHFLLQLQGKISNDQNILLWAMVNYLYQQLAKNNLTHSTFAEFCKDKIEFWEMETKMYTDAKT